MNKAYIEEIRSVDIESRKATELLVVLDRIAEELAINNVIQWERLHSTDTFPEDYDREDLLRLSTKGK